MIKEVQQGVVVDAKGETSASKFPLKVSHTLPVPPLRSEYDVLIKVVAVALNPTGFKMVSSFSRPGDMTGCDFYGVVADKKFAPQIKTAILPGARNCGGGFPYTSRNPINGSFTQFVVADARLLLVVPVGYSDLEAAALGTVTNMHDLFFESVSHFNFILEPASANTFDKEMSEPMPQEKTESKPCIRAKSAQLLHKESLRRPEDRVSGRRTE